MTLDFPAVLGVPCEVPAGMAEGLGARPSECFRAMDYMVVFDSERDIVGPKPNFQRLADLDVRGVIVTALGRTVDFVSRFFAPKYGVDDDPVTGSAHCTLAPFWAERMGKSVLVARQLSRRTGTLRCRVEAGRVFLSGYIVPYLEGVIHIL